MAIIVGTQPHPALRDVAVPTLVLHGDQDKLVDISGGRRTAEVHPRRPLRGDGRHGPRLPAGVLGPLGQAGDGTRPRRQPTFFFEARNRFYRSGASKNGVHERSVTASPLKPGC